MKSIRSRLILSMSISIFAVLGIIVGIVGITVRNSTLEQAYSSVELQAKYSSKKVQQKLEFAMDISRTLANSFESLKETGSTSRGDMNMILKNVLSENPDFLGVWTIWEPNALDEKDDVYKDTEGHDGTGRFIPYWYWSGGNMHNEPCASYDAPGDGDYYLLARDSGMETILEPFEYDIEGKTVLMTSIVAPVIVDNKVLGAVGVDISLEALQSISDEIKVMETGYGTIISNLGIYVTHPIKELVGTNMFETEMDQKEEIQKALKDGTISTTFQQDKTIGKRVYSVLTPVEIGNSETPWAVATVISIDEVTESVNKLILLITAIGLAGILVLIVFTWYVSGMIANPIRELSQVIDRLSKYDLSFDENSKAIKYIKRKDEIGLITNALAEMQKNLISLIKGIADISQQVAASSEELTATSQQSATAANEVARTIEEIANGAGDQAKNTEEGAGHISELGQLIEKDQRYVNNLNITANEVSMLKDEGLESLKDLVEKTNINNKASEDIHATIINTNESAKKIENASQMIRSIAEQTNLLALNAAIEAARAGETGRGFAVVAEEIRKLSEQSNAFTSEIYEVIKELTGKTQHAVETMEEVGKLFVSQAKSVDKSNEKFEGIAAAIEKMKIVIANINESGQEMENKKNQIIGIIENLSAISEENAAGTQEASASIEEQTSSIEEIANASESLAKLAEEMQESISRFKY